MNFCWCKTTTYYKPKKDCEDELRLRDIVTINEASPVPCGQGFSIDLLEHSDFTICDGVPLSLTIIDYDETAFNSLSINDGILTGNTESIAFDTKPFYKIVIKGTCGIYGDYMTIRVRFNDPCIGVDCPGQNCDICGNCIPINT